MRIHTLILLFMLSCSTRGLCQEYVAKLNIDSLKNVLLTAKDTVRINTLTLLSKRILFGAQTNGYMDTAGALAAEALSLSKQLKYGKGLANATLNQVIINVNRGKDARSSLSLLAIAIPLLQQAGDMFSVANAYGSKGSCHHFLGENTKAVQAFDSSVQLFQQLGDTVSSVWTLIGLGHSYCDLGNYKSSYKTFHRVQELAHKTDTILQCYAFCQLAALFVAANLPEIALEYMQKVRSFYPSLTTAQQKDLPWPISWSSRVGGEAFLQMNQVDSAVKIAAFLHIPFEKQDAPDNLFHGNLYAALGDYQKALAYFRHGYETSQHKSYEIGHALHAIALATTYLRLKEYTRGFYYAKEALQTAKKMHGLAQERSAVGILSKLYAATGNYTKAYQYNQLYKVLNDSLAPEEYKRKLSLVQIRDQLELQKKDAAILSKQNQLSHQLIKVQESALKRKSLLLYVFIAIVLLLITLGILIRRNIILARRKLELQQLMDKATTQAKLIGLEKEKSDLEMQALRAQMNPHFIFNCLSSINRFILINKIDEASDYLTKFSRLIRMALHNSEKSLITLEAELEALRLYLDLERLRFKSAFDYNITLTNTIDINTVYIPPMLIQPFAENAIWHGLMHKKSAGRLDIKLSAADKILTCAIIDNGIGREMAASLNSRSAEKTKSMGVHITTGRLAMLSETDNERAVCSIEDLINDHGQGCGTKVVLGIPYKDLTEVVE